MKMKATFFLSLLLCFQLFTTENKAIAGIAYPYPVEFKQADGSIITILLKGDEKVKWAETPDGFAILFNGNGIYEYARMNKEGDMVPSGIRVKNIADRTAEEMTFLSQTPKSLHFSASQLAIMKSVWNVRQAQSTSVFPTTGNRKLVCILMEFQDVHFTKTKTDFENLFNQINYSAGGATGSVKDYYLETSYNQFNLTVTVAGVYRAAHNMAYYGANTGGQGTDIRPREFVTEAVIAADPDLNYADFDNDNDGTVDGVYVIYAGYNEGAGASTDAIWYHSWSIPTINLDGKDISKYACSSELDGTSGSVITGIGGICHEFGHVLGALDFYDTDYGTNGQYNGTGHWDVMGAGNWNNNSRTPAHHNPYNKSVVYGWVTPTMLVSGNSYTLSNSTQNSNSFYRYNTTTPNEYYLLENKQQIKFDGSDPGHGLLIYHVDGNFIAGAGNAINAGSHQGMYQVCASAGGNPPSTYGNSDGDGCPYPGTSDKHEFTDATTPNSHSWAGNNTGLPITGITENNTAKTISFCFVDVTPPTAIAKNITKNLNGAGTAVITAADIDNGSFDNCSTVTLAAGKTSFGCSDLGTNNVKLTVTDAGGNTATANAVVTIADVTNPVAIAKNITVTLDPTGHASITGADIDNGSHDNCSISGLAASKTSFGCPDLGVMTVTLTVTDESGNTATAASTVTVVEGTALLSPFVSCVVGASAGTAIYTPCTGNGRFTLNSTGYSSTNSDVQESVCRSLTGDGSIIARVYDLTGGGWAGVQIREDCGAGSKKVLIKTQLQTMLKADVRQTTGGATLSTQILRQGIKWLKLVRSGNRFDTYTSVDGIAWMPAFSTTLVMNANVQIGIFSEGMTFSRSYQARFDNVVVTGSAKSAESDNLAVNTNPDNLLEIYPNPASKLVNVLIPEPVTKVNLTIVSSDGKIVRSGPIENISSQVDISALKPGIYILRFDLDGIPVTKRLVIL